VLRELTAWREQEARHRDRPRGHIVKDDVLVTLAQRKPTNNGALRDVQGVSDNAVRNYGDAIVEAVKRGLDVPKSDRPKPTRRRRKDDTEIARFDLAQALIKGRSLSHEIDPGLIGNRASVERLVAAGPDADPAEHAVLRGWRREFVGEAVLDLLRGECSVSVDPETDLPRLVPNSEQTSP
jgi:ribonuclease D